MSAGFVVDASVGFSWVYRDQATPDTDKLLLDIAAGVPVVVPSFWFLEMANVLLMAERRRKLTSAQRKAAAEQLTAMQFKVDEEATRVAFERVSDLAHQHGLSIYDAVYLELALRRKMPLATRDAALKAAARKSGLKVL